MIPESVLDTVAQLSNAILDAYVVVGLDQTIIDFNPVFYSLFPRNVARQLKKKTFREVVELELHGEPLDLAAQCMQKEKPLRFDEIVGRIQGGDSLNLIASCAPLINKRTLVGTAICLRDVTDEAQVQVKYKSLLDDEVREREVLKKRIEHAERELIDVKDLLSGVENELREYKKGLLV
jgi:hypothetical protein